MAKSDFFGSMKDAGILLGREKNRDIFGLQKRTKGFFGGILKKVVIFLVDKF